MFSLPGLTAEIKADIFLTHSIEEDGPVCDDVSREIYNGIFDGDMDYDPITRKISLTEQGSSYLRSLDA